MTLQIRLQIIQKSHPSPGGIPVIPSVAEMIKATDGISQMAIPSKCRSKIRYEVIRIFDSYGQP